MLSHHILNLGLFGYHLLEVLNSRLARMGRVKKIPREREREIERERESGAVGATSTPSTVGLFSFLTMLFLPTFSQH